MLRGATVALRARVDADVAVLHAELYDDIVTRSRADGRPWRPVSADAAAAPFRKTEPTADAELFSVIELARDELAGAAELWHIDLHNRSAHLGVTLRPAFRGRGLGTDVVRVLCLYGFAVRGLHRLQLETLADNTAMIRAATRNGFVHEGTLRAAAWLGGEFVDEALYGILDWQWDAVSPPDPLGLRASGPDRGE
ncbi:MAG TPA: GNAT family protein [Jatrophihabitans sp.]|nr:GNAT family protein [Jatrophihabitans sp.]